MIQETWVRSLGWEDPLEKVKDTQSSILENSMDCIVHGIANSWTRVSDFHIYFKNICIYNIDLLFPLHLSCTLSRFINIFLSSLKGYINCTEIRTHNGFN